jgi:hypothetical protein
MWRVDPLLGNDSEISKSTKPLLSNRFGNKHVCTATIGNSNIGKVFSVRSVPRCYKQDSWSNELVVRQSPDGKNRHGSRGHSWDPSPNNDS